MSMLQKPCATWRLAANEQAQQMQQRLQVSVCTVSRCILLESAPHTSHQLYNVKLDLVCQPLSCHPLIQLLSCRCNLMLSLLQTSGCQLVSPRLIPPAKRLSCWIQKSSSLEAHQAMLHVPAITIRPYDCDCRVEILEYSSCNHCDHKAMLLSLQVLELQNRQWQFPHWLHTAVCMVLSIVKTSPAGRHANSAKHVVKSCMFKRKTQQQPISAVKAQ